MVRLLLLTMGASKLVRGERFFRQFETSAADFLVAAW
jgi:hypothetical protein